MALIEFDLLFRRELPQCFSGRHFQIDRQAIRIQAGLPDQIGARIRNRFQVDVAAERVGFAKCPGDAKQTFHGVVGGTNDARGQEQSLDVVALIERQGQVDDFVHGEACPAHVGGPPVDAIGTVENAGIRQQDFQQGNTASVGRIGMADAVAGAGSDPGAVPGIARGSAGRSTGRVIFCRIGQDRQLIHDREGLYHVPDMFKFAPAVNISTLSRVRAVLLTLVRRLGPRPLLKA